MLTQGIINEFATLLAVEDQTIWDVGDKINQYELGREEIEALSEEVDRSVSLLWSRAHLAKMFPKDLWERESAPIGVWEQLSRLDKPADRRRLLKKKVWTVNAIRKEIDQILLDKDPPPPLGSAGMRVTRFMVDGVALSMKSELSPTGVLSLTLPTPIAPGTTVETEVGEDGTLRVRIPLALEEIDERHLKVVK